ncbi:ABC transporter ATP-binding protein [Candidatus Bathyarchaeota archaeon]|nr:ABC transporter ATP-binding protein [Candidatus Bathyarchaeota archaeon]
MEAIVEFFDVWKAYDGIQALQGLCLEVRRGEIFGLIGPNGAGKTTALKIIVGLLKMDKGFVRVNGYDITEEPYEYKRFIGYVPEAISLPEYLTVEEFLIYSGMIRGVEKERIRGCLEDYLRIFSLEDRRRSLILTLSRGMRQKTAIASALIHDPDLLILDEPFIGIDPEGQHRIKELFVERVKEGRAVLVSTHMLDTAERLCDRISVIHRGKNVASGDMEGLRRLSERGEGATLEEVFLKLTEEASKPYEGEEPSIKRGSRFPWLFGRRGT